MAILIDGYNLLHATGIVGHGNARSALERSRTALLNFLSDSLDADEIAVTTVVFDANDAPPGLPRVTRHAGLTLHFASQYEEADALIEELIRADSVPRQLVVVSSDHRIQRAARRRKATAVDSDVWFDEIVKRREIRERESRPADRKPQLPLSKHELDHWVDAFADVELEELEPPPIKRKSGGPETRPDKTSPPADPDAERSDRNNGRKGEKDRFFQDGDDIDLTNPFPPGYADDLFDEE